MMFEDGNIVDGFVVLKDADGKRHGLWSVQSVYETEDGETVLTVGGSRMILVDRDFDVTMQRLDVAARPPVRR